MKILLKKGFVVDPENNLNGEFDILIENGKISKIAKDITEEAEIYNLTGKTVFPGFIDMHVHLREPGREDKETIETGLAAAAAGGFTGVAPMPNTNPICDNKVIVEYIKLKAREAGTAKLYPIGAVTKGEQGSELAGIGSMYNCGIVAVSDDGKPVMNSLIAKRAFEYIKMFDIPLICHAEDEHLAAGGAMNYGDISIRLGIPGIPNEAEDIIVGRDIILAEATKSRLHIAHASTAGTLRMVKEAKVRGVNVTVEVAPHHFSLSDAEVEKQNYNTYTKVNPPLRTQKDVDYILDCIKDGTVDIIATDHAPHTETDKQVEYTAAPFGMSGIETAVGATVTFLLNKGIIDKVRMAELLSVNPRKIFKIDGGIAEGKSADISIIDLNQEWVVDSALFYSKGKNTPINGVKLNGKPYMTIVDGRVVMKDGVIIK